MASNKHAPTLKQIVSTLDDAIAERRSTIERLGQELQGQQAELAQLETARSDIAGQSRRAATPVPVAARPGARSRRPRTPARTRSRRQQVSSSREEQRQWLQQVLAGGKILTTLELAKLSGRSGGWVRSLPLHFGDILETLPPERKTVPPQPLRFRLLGAKA